MRQTRMLTTALALLSTTRLLAADAPAGPLLKTGDRVAIIGDSITEQKQYSVMIESYLRACAPQFQAAVIQLGWSGERAGGFAKRMDNDLMGWKPTVATLCYGMNDGGYQPYNESIGAEYRKQMSAIAERFAGAGVRVVVGSPGVVDSFTWRKEQPDADLAYNVNLATLGGIGREIARGAWVRVRGRARGDEQRDDPRQGGAGGGLRGGRRRRRASGAERAPLHGLRLPQGAGAGRTHRGNPAGVAGGSEGVGGSHGQIRPGRPRGDREHALSVLLFRRCKDPNAPAGILPFLPFQADLNRFTLVVTGLTAPKADVAWGGAAKTFTREQLEAGVNLAEAFPDNPAFARPSARW
ncbi:MAG: GDSL-type esterase/lipase family protein [Kiritimatiellia bacterium]